MGQITYRFSSTLDGGPTSMLPMPFRFFDPRHEIEEISGNLPHWRQEGALYFVTFRAADSIPAEKLLRWQEEKQLWLAAHPMPWDEPTRHEYLERFSGRLQEWLDADAGECLLSRPPLRKVVESTLRHFRATLRSG